MLGFRIFFFSFGIGYVLCSGLSCLGECGCFKVLWYLFFPLCIARLLVFAVLFVYFVAIFFHLPKKEENIS